MTDLRDIPEGRLEKPVHHRMWRAVRSARYELEPAAREIARALPYPRYYFDFETIAFAVPIWEGTRPYTQHPFQWSCHIEPEAGALTHCPFLDVSGSNPTRTSAERLVDVLGTSGPVIVYFAPFERTRLQELAAACPDLAPRLEHIIERLFDLRALMKEHYYHPDLKGSWSIKRVLHTIAPDLNYDGLGDVRRWIRAAGLPGGRFSPRWHPVRKTGYKHRC